MGAISRKNLIKESIKKPPANPPIAPKIKNLILLGTFLLIAQANNQPVAEPIIA